MINGNHVADLVRAALAARRADAIDVVYDTLDPLLRASRLDEARAILRAFAQSDLPLAVLLSALAVSWPWRAVLGEARVWLAQRAMDVAKQDGGAVKASEIARFL